MPRPKINKELKKVAVSATIDPALIKKAMKLKAAKGKNRSTVIGMALTKLIECEKSFDNLLKSKANE